MKSSEERYKEYLNFKKKYQKYWGETGDYKKEQVEIVEDVSLFPKCEEGSIIDMINRGFTKNDAKRNAQIGVRDYNKWGITVCEPLRFPNGAYLTFVRIISWGSLDSGYAGIVVVPETTEGKYIFVKSYRNATRNFCLEFPRGAKDVDKNMLKTIKSELSEEVGAEIVKGPNKIGDVFPDSGLLGSKVEINHCVVKVTGDATQEITEAIGGIVILDLNQIKKTVKDGFFIDKKGIKYEFKDGYTLSALQLLGL